MHHNGASRLSQRFPAPNSQRLRTHSFATGCGRIPAGDEKESKMAIDMDKLNAFIGRFVTDLGASVHTGMVVIGEKLGLYKALAVRAMTSAELATATKTDERYVREWLSSQAA